MGLSHTVSGDIASFRTPSRVPIESLKFHFLPKQEGSGDPSPTNVCPITGWTGLNGRRAGKNLIEPHYGVETVQRDLTITPSTNGISVSGTASARTAILLSKADKNTKLGVGDKVTFSLYLNGDISECESPFLGYYKSRGVWGGVIGQLSSENNRKITWTVPNTYTDDSILDSYIYVPQGVTVNFEIGLQMEAGSNATNYEPYSEEQIPITFPTNGKNLVNDETTTIRGWMEKNGHRYTSTKVDTRDAVSLYVQQLDQYGNILRNNVKYTSVTLGRNSLTIDTVKGCNRIMFKHNGKINDFGIYIPWDGRIGTYTISANIESMDLTTVGGFVFSDVQIELGDTMTSYEVYSSDNTFYGGYIDPVAGEIVAEFKVHIFNGEERIRDYPGSFTDGIRLVSEEFDDCTGAGNLTKCDKAPLEKNVPSTITRLGIRIGGGVGRFYFYIPDSMFDGEATVEKFNEWLSENNMTVVAKLTTPIRIPIPAQDLKAFLDHNNFWSDANDITEVTYAVTESKDMLMTRKLAIDFDHAHHKKVKWNNLVNGYLSSDDWGDRDSNDTTTTFENGVSETTFLTKKRTFYTMRSKNEPRVDLSHKYFAYAEYFFDESFSQLPQTGFEYAGGKTLYATPTSLGDGWYYVKGIVSGNRNGGGYMYIPFLLVNSETDSGQKVKTRNVLYMDLTLMFGEGKEPATSNELLKLFEINGINVHEPHSKDITGTDQWLIIP